MLGLAIMSVLPGHIMANTTEIAATRSPYLVLIERNGLKFKADKILRERSMGHCRIRMDIRHCFLPGLPVVADHKNGSSSAAAVVLVAKHLCGLATDLSVRSIHNLVRKSPVAESVPAAAGPLFKGLAIATCCHHACSWADYTGVQWLCSEQGFTETEFSVMKQWSGWAHTIKIPSDDNEKKSAGDDHPAKRIKRGEGDLDEEEEICCEHSAPINESVIRPTDVSSREMSDVGKMVKRILDQGRVEYLRRLGLAASQVQYCHPSLSPECYMIITSGGTSGVEVGK